MQGGVKPLPVACSQAHARLAPKEQLLVQCGARRFEAHATRSHVRSRGWGFSVVLRVDGELIVVVRTLITTFARGRAAGERAAGPDPRVRAWLFPLEAELASARPYATVCAARQWRPRHATADLRVDSRNGVCVDHLVRVLWPDSGVADQLARALAAAAAREAHSFSGVIIFSPIFMVQHVNMPIIVVAGQVCGYIW